MDQVAPAGGVYQAGTLSGNPLAVAAGLETLRRLEDPAAYEKLGRASSRLAEGLAGIAQEVGVELCTVSVGGMWGFFFHTGPVHDYEAAKKANAARFVRFFASMLDQGIYLAPSSFEAGFVSLAHRTKDLDRTLEAARVALRRAARVR
jgi:glutamate-1-semialdehyde 2,1-aminomutase